MVKKTSSYELKKQKFDIKHASTEITPSLEQKTLSETKKHLAQKAPKKDPSKKMKEETVNVVVPNRQEQQMQPLPAVNPNLNLSSTNLNTPIPKPQIQPNRNQSTPQRTSTSTTQGQKKVNVTKVQARPILNPALTLAAVQMFQKNMTIKQTSIRQLTTKSQNEETRLERRLVDEDLKEERKEVKKEAEQEKKAVEREARHAKEALAKPIKVQAQPKPRAIKEKTPESKHPEWPSLKR